MTMIKPLMVFLLQFVSLFLADDKNCVFVAGHARLECPPPLSGATGEKVGPCDTNVDNGSVPAYPLQANAFNTITWLESIPHPGAPSRFALSGEGGDEIGLSFETCLLLDHVPHDARSRPSFRNAASWHRSSITLWIPDIYCERCHLQLISVMSDTQHGVPADTRCVYRGAAEAGTTESGFVSELVDLYPICPAVYHSCSPVSINGSVPRNEIDRCNTTEFEEKLGWPLTPSTTQTRNSAADLYQHSVYFNRGDVGLYSETNATLVEIGSPISDANCTNALYCDPEISFDAIFTVPENSAYASPEGSCTYITGMKVEAYQPGGILPSVPKEGSPMLLDSSTTDADFDNSTTLDEEEDKNDSASVAILLASTSFTAMVTTTIIIAMMCLSTY